MVLRRLALNGRVPFVAVVAVAAIVGIACGGQSPAAQKSSVKTTSVRIASYDFSESRLLAQLYALALERRGFHVTLALGLGSREVVDPALAQHSVDLVPEYAGAALRFLRGGQSSSSDSAASYAALRRAFGELGVVTLAAARAEDKNGFVVSLRTAREKGWETISDLSPAAPALAFGGPAECAERPLCMQGLRNVYGLRFREFTPFKNQAVTAAALRTGEIDVGMLDTTSAELTRHDLLLLSDDRHLEPAENVVPVVNKEALKRFGPRLAAVVDAVSAHLLTSDLVTMNRAVALGGADARSVAAEWLRRHNLW